VADRETRPERGYRTDIGGLFRLVDPNDFRLARQMRIPTATNGVVRVSNASRVGAGGDSSNTGFHIENEVSRHAGGSASCRYSPASLVGIT